MIREFGKTSVWVTELRVRGSCRVMRVKFDHEPQQNEVVKLKTAGEVRRYKIFGKPEIVIDPKYDIIAMIEPVS